MRSGEARFRLYSTRFVLWVGWTAVTSGTTPQFNFDRQLWRRFIKVAQPYFYPLGRRSFSIFVALLALSFYFSFSLLFFLTCSVVLTGYNFNAAFTNRIAPGLADKLVSLLQSPFAIITGLGIVIPILTFGLLFENLRSRWRQWSLLTILLFLSLSVSGLNVVISYVSNFFQTALSERNQPQFWTFLFVYAGVFVVGTPIVVIYEYVQQKLGLLWREWLTNLFLNNYLANRAYYELDSNSSHTEIDNPDQRITQDVASFTRVTLSFLLIILRSIIDLISFTGILFSISKSLTFGLIIYATAATIITVFFGKKLIGLNFAQLRLEADFRYSLVHVRDNAESIAFYQGESQEKQSINRRFRRVLANFDFLIKWQRNLAYFTTGYNYLTMIIPALILAPRYFAGQLRFGDITQGGFAFRQVLDSVSLIINQIEGITAFAASINRLGEFYEILQEPRKNVHQENQIQIQTAQQLSIQKMTLFTPNSEQELVRDLTVNLAPDERLLIVGASGVGKSSILRAVAGLWRNGAGIVVRPDIREMLFLPQRPYMVLGTLREQLLYPANDETITNEQLQKVLDRVNLGYLTDRFNWDEILDWPMVLSLGEQQRLAFARLFLCQPRYAMLDEATSALDVTNERHLYQQLQQTSVVYLSVGHRPTLVDYHQKVLELMGGGAWQMWTAAEYRAKLAQMVG